MSKINSMERMKQTSRTILFEEFNSSEDGKSSLFDLLNLEENFNNDAFNKTVREKLEVRSFKEFLEKFAPKVYEICEAIDGKPMVHYTTDAKLANERHGVEQKITDNVYYKMLCQLYTEKGASGDANLVFKDDEILQMLSPRQEVEEAKDLRKKLQSSLEKYHKLQDKNENANEYAQKFIACRTEIANKYQQSQIALLPLAIEDLKRKIDYLDDTDKKASEQALLGTGGVVSGYLTYSEDGEMIVKSLPAAENNTQVLLPAAHDIGSEIKAIVERDYDRSQGEDNNSFVRALVTRTYAPLANTNFTNKSLEEIKEEKEASIALRKSYEDLYTQAKQSFIDEMTKVLQKLMGVKIFFDHATANGGEEDCLPDNAPLLVTNCKASKLIKGKMTDKFTSFIKHRGSTEVENKIWFAILPDVNEGENVIQDKVKIDPLADLDPFGDMNANDQAINESMVSFSAAKTVLQILNDARVMTVFNFTADKDNNTFDSLNEKYVRATKENLKGLNYDHAALAYPNFTITRERKVDIDEEKNNKLTVHGVYVDAAYVAAGLLVGSQQIKYLEKHGFKNNIDPSNVCVRVDLEGEQERKNLQTNFNREIASRWDTDLKSEISKDKFGFAFCSDAIYADGEPLKNTYIYFARTLKTNAKGIYKPIYRVLTEDFIRQYLKQYDPLTSKEVQGFVNTECVIWSQEIKRADKYTVNMILQADEEITYDKENNKLKTKFKDDEAVINDIDIEQEE